MAVCGPAFPVSCPPGDNLPIHQAIYAAQPGDVLVAGTGGGAEFGYFGEVMARAAVQQGIAGLVIDGGVRDADRVAALGFPVFAALRCIRGTAKRPDGGGTVGQPVTLGDVVVSRADAVVGDGDGVVVIPAAGFAAVLASGQAREASEAEVFSRISAGETTLAIYSLPG
jgi:4-hydroxy-4-methyl-2-oxoglutarate aldolase